MKFILAPLNLSVGIAKDGEQIVKLDINGVLGLVAKRGEWVFLMPAMGEDKALNTKQMLSFINEMENEHKGEELANSSEFLLTRYAYHCASYLNQENMSEFDPQIEEKIIEHCSSPFFYKGQLTDKH